MNPHLLLAIVYLVIITGLVVDIVMSRRALKPKPAFVNKNQNFIETETMLEPVSENDIETRIMR